MIGWARFESGAAAALAIGRAALITCIIATRALAAWPGSPGVNVPVCTAAGEQIVPQVTDDGAGGVIIVWVDHRAGAAGDLYALRLDVQGNRPAGWPANGLAVCTAPGAQDNPTIVADGAGGAVIAWTDARSGTGDIYALRLQANGTLASGWPANGLPLCTAPGNQGPAWILGDDAGGAFVVWRDARGGTFDLYATRVRNNGNITGQWPANGLAVCTAPGGQDLVALATDMQGGLYVAWQDERAGSLDIYAHRLRNNGSFVNGWGANGLAVCASAGHQFAPAVASDGNRGFYVVWEDFRAGATADLFGLRVLENGSAASGWAAGGTPLCSAAGHQFSVQAFADGAGNADLVWEDYRNGSGNADVFALKVRSNGSNFFLWPANGVAVCTAPGHQLEPTLVSDGSLGMIVLWEDYRAGVANADVYAKRVGLLGVFPSYWATDGIPVSNAATSQQFVAAAVGTNPIAVWQDGRSGNGNIYAQRVEVQGTLGMNGPVVMSAQPVPGFETNDVWLTWFASPLERGGPPGRIASYRLWRDRVSERADVQPARAVRSPTERRSATTRSPVAVGRLRANQPAGVDEDPYETPVEDAGHDWEHVATIAADGSHAYSLAVALPASPPASPGYGLFFVEAVDSADPQLAWPSVIFEAVPSTLPDPTAVNPRTGADTPGLESPCPNPVSTSARIRFALAREAPVVLAIFAADGRRIRVLARGTLGAGPHEITWDRRTDDGRPVPGGVYFVRLEAAGRRFARRISVVP